MLRGIAVAVAQLLLTPPMAVAGVLLHAIRPKAEFIPKIGRAWSRMILAIGGIEVVVEGADIPRRHRPAVVVGNHASHVDSYLAAAVLPQPIRFVAKASLFRIPFFGQALRSAGMVKLERQGEQTDIDRLEALHEILSRDAVVVFFPEGTRSHDGRLREFKKGGFVMAIKTGVPVIPMAIAGAHRAHPAGTLRFVPGKVTVRILDPVSTTGLTFDDRDRLIELVRERIAAALPPDQRPAPPAPAQRKTDG
ncbi:MAG: 1-acyl-sn-glycerol-3-phosphate acyltransferase [Acidobacteriota bacterium]|nr:1-acyl-sn-glycerol-3-phosphate acyltransferase [Acidobacteriota bacterium]